MTLIRPEYLYTLADLLPVAQKRGYAIGAFSPRVTPLIQPVLLAAKHSQSPVIVQISQKEFERYQLTPVEFADEFFYQLQQEPISIPVVLHLDHTRQFEIIQQAIDAGFTSVMIDASERVFTDNVAITREVVSYAHDRHVSVEAELGRIGTTDFVETDQDAEYFTDPAEAQQFVSQTGVDALAVSVGTAHGVYKVRQPRIDCRRLEAIRVLISTPLVLHGGSGVPASLMAQAIRLPGGGVSKVNIATDLELAALQALQRPDYLTNAEFLHLPTNQIKKASSAVYQITSDKISNFVHSKNRSQDYNGEVRRENG
jgi:ketose-bisphosphate aldolase